MFDTARLHAGLDAGATRILSAPDVREAYIAHLLAHKAHIAVTVDATGRAYLKFRNTPWYTDATLAPGTLTFDAP